MIFRINNKGFTLIEVLAVVAIIGIFFGFLLPQANSAFYKSKETGIYTDFRTFQHASESFFRETSGTRLQVDGFNSFIASEHQVVDSGVFLHTKSKDPWKNHYVVEFDHGKITFASYGKKENSTDKVYKMVTYLHKGITASCTKGFGARDIVLSLNDLPDYFECGDPITITDTPQNPPSGIPNTPTNFKAFNVTETSLDLSWDSMKDATFYVVERNNLKVYSGDSVSFSDQGLSPNTAYTYSVTAFNSLGNRNPATLTVITVNRMLLPPSAPSSFIISNITDKSADLSWSKVNNATSYELKRNGLVIYTGSNLSYSDISLSESTSYTYTLVAKNSAGSSSAKTQTITTLGNFKVKSLFVGWDNVFAIKLDGTLWGWGTNHSGSLGIKDVYFTYTPMQIGKDTNWKKVIHGGGTIFALKSDGSLWGWGSNSNGELGLGDAKDRETPTRIGTDSNWAEVYYSNESIAALKTDGTLWTWGRNNDTKLGHGDNVNRNVPTKVGTSADWKAFSFGINSAIALKKDGSLWSWGKNDYGQLGQGDFKHRSSPTKIGTATWKSIFSFSYDVFAMKDDNTLWGWGDNGSGILGLGDSVTRNTPTQIGKDTDWDRMDIGDFAPAFIKKDGMLWTWENIIKADFNAPISGNIVPLNTDAQWDKLFISYNFYNAIKKDGTLWSWGLNDSGALGQGDTTIQKVPTQVGKDADWDQIYSGYNFVFGVKKDGTLWSWGANNYGQLGQGDTTERFIPTKVVSKK